MNIISKKYYLELDTKTFTPYIDQKFVCKRNDSILFYITVKADDEILDLTGCKISLVSARCNGSLIEHTIKDYKLEKFLEISDDLGLAFQIQDDILDYEGDFETIGKTPLKDVNSNKQTYVNQFGLEDAKLKVITLFKNIYNSIEEILDLNKTYLCELVDLIKNRRK